MLREGTLTLYFAGWPSLWLLFPSRLPQRRAELSRLSAAGVRELLVLSSAERGVLGYVGVRLDPDSKPHVPVQIRGRYTCECARRGPGHFPGMHTQVGVLPGRKARGHKR